MRRCGHFGSCISYCLFSSGGAGGHCGTPHYDQLLDFPSVAFVGNAVSLESEF